MLHFYFQSESAKKPSISRHKIYINIYQNYASPFPACSENYSKQHGKNPYLRGENTSWFCIKKKKKRTWEEFMFNVKSMESAKWKKSVYMIINTNQRF